MNRHAAKWTVALLLSAALHAGAAVWFGTGADTVEVAGGARAEIAVLGNAFHDAAAAGEMTESVEPVSAETVPVAPVESERPTEPIQQTRPPAQTMVVSETLPKPVEARQTSTVDAVDGGIAIAALQPAAAAPATSPRSEAAEPVAHEEAPTPETTPLPTPRPVRQAIVDKPEPQPRRKEHKAETTAQSKPAGGGGAARENKRRGTAEGTRQALTASSGNAGRSRDAGNAAVSNYPGKVFAKLRRSLRYPREARSKRIRGEVHVRFTVSRAGGVGSIRVARSSGSSLLDNAALETVRRAAPFPAIPADAGRSSWSFTVPLAFTR